MNKVVLIVLILCVILSMVRVEKFSNSPSADINDEEVDMSMYKKMEDADITKESCKKWFYVQTKKFLNVLVFVRI